MKIKIFKSYDTVADYIKIVSEYADQFKKELGFLPRSAYEEQAIKGRLWVAVSGGRIQFKVHH